MSSVLIMQVLYFVLSCDCSSNSSEMSGNSPDSGEQNPPMEQEKRIRREIANSNERRRMQSINAGFQSLRTLLPHHEGEKLSKVSNALPLLSPRSVGRLLLLSACVIYTRGKT
jgi:Helix-loop-helix DNA-binding domain